MCCRPMPIASGAKTVRFESEFKIEVKQELRLGTADYVASEDLQHRHLRMKFDNLRPRSIHSKAESSRLCALGGVDQNERVTVTERCINNFTAACQL